MPLVLKVLWIGEKVFLLYVTASNEIPTVRKIDAKNTQVLIVPGKKLDDILIVPYIRMINDISRDNEWKFTSEELEIRTLTSQYSFLANLLKKTSKISLNSHDLGELDTNEERRKKLKKVEEKVEKTGLLKNPMIYVNSDQSSDPEEEYEEADVVELKLNEKAQRWLTFARRQNFEYVEMLKKQKK
jgi:hypothetical protein